MEDSARSHCGNCGAQLQADARFCGGCGASVSRADAVWACASCDAANPADNRFCSHCGKLRTAAPPSSPVVSQPVSARPDAPARFLTGKRTAAVVGVLLVAGGVGSAVAFAVAGGGSPEAAVAAPASPKERSAVAASSRLFNSRVAAIVRPLVSRQRRVTGRAGFLRPNSLSFGRLARAASELEVATLKAEGAAEGLAPQKASERATRKVLIAAIRRQGKYGELLAQLDGPASLTPALARTAVVRARITWQAYRKLAQLTAAPCCQRMPLDLTAQQNLVTVAIDVKRQRELAKRRRAEAARMAAFVDKIEDFLEQSANGRGEIISAISSVTNGCTISPEEAARQVDSVVRNRQSLLDKLRALTTTSP